MLLVGDVQMNLLGPFEIHVGFSENFKDNLKCKDGPYLSLDDGTIGTFDWQNGIEAWCNLYGTHVSIVRDASAVSTPSFSICDLLAIADPDTAIFFDIIGGN